MGKRHNEDDFNPTTQASEYNAAQRRHEAREWVAGQHRNGGDSGLDKATRSLQLDANKR